MLLAQQQQNDDNNVHTTTAMVPMHCQQQRPWDNGDAVQELATNVALLGEPPQDGNLRVGHQGWKADGNAFIGGPW
jgi:hypothetical protein